MNQMNQFIKLNNGMQIPQLGFGCFQIKDSEIEQVIQYAADAGYRYFDTATRYENEAGVGRALRKCGVPREDLFVVSKIWPTSYDDPERAIEYSLRQLDLDYIDSYYLHWPSSSEDRRNRAMEKILEYQGRGLIKSIGVSNFTIEHLKKLVDRFAVTPVMNQIELHPFYQQRELCAYCRSSNIAITAWGPIFKGHIDEVPLMKELSDKYIKSPVQITLRWHIQHGNIVIPKSSHQDRIIANTQIFDFQISDEDMQLIDGLENGTHLGSDPNTNDGLNFTI